MTWRSHNKAALAAAAAALALLAGACGGGKSGTGSASSSHSTTTTEATTSSLAGGSSSTSTSEGGKGANTQVTSSMAGTGSAPASGSNGQGSSGNVSTGSSSANLGAPQDPGAANAPADGYYKYKSTDDAGDVTQLTIQISETAAATGTTKHQKLAVTTKNGSESNNYDWSPGGINVNSTALAGGQFQATCTWTTPVEQYVFNAAKLTQGQKWHSSSSGTCTASGSATGFKATETMDATVGSWARISEAGKVLDTWVITRHSVFTANSQPTFNLTIDTTSTEWFSPKYGQTPKVINDTKTSGSYQGKPFSNQAKSTVEAETLDPSPTSS
ncbi:MAG TPA: hypothetical protein VE990_16670 [Acidimicrobiales bacterium]|nr:hypothetical protein [Acidimicrobiales bacterium]